MAPEDSHRSKGQLLAVKTRRGKVLPQAQARGCSGVCCKQGAGKAMLGDWGGGRMELWGGSRWLGVHYGGWGGGWWQQTMVWGARALVPEMHGLYLKWKLRWKHDSNRRGKWQLLMGRA